MKTSELTGELLNYWVAKAEGYEARLCQGYLRISRKKNSLDLAELGYTPSTDWLQGGPIIEREKITLLHEGAWEAITNWATCYGQQACGPEFGGETALIAAMRAYVFGKYGDEVPDFEGT